MRANPIGVRPAPSSPTRTTPKKTLTRTERTKRTGPWPGSWRNRHEPALKMRSSGYARVPSRGDSFPTARCGFGPVGIQGAVRSVRSVRARVLPFWSCCLGSCRLGRCVLVVKVLRVQLGLARRNHPRARVVSGLPSNELAPYAPCPFSPLVSVDRRPGHRAVAVRAAMAEQLSRWALERRPRP